MKLKDAIELIRDSRIAGHNHSAWADLGCGSGLFTNALAQQLSPGSKIYAVDKNVSTFRKKSVPENISIGILSADFIQNDLPLHDLDGILMANSLQFVRDKISLLTKLRRYLKPRGSFLIIEYDMDTPNPWVPYPISYDSLQQLFRKFNAVGVHKIHERPSVYNRANIYSALLSL